MATLRARNGKWQVQVRRAGSPVLSRTFHHRADAQKWARQTEAQVDRVGLHPDLKVLRQTTLSQVIDRFRASEIPTRKGGANEQVVLKAFQRTKLAHLSLAELKPSHFATYRDERLRTVKAGTVIREMGLVQTILEIARAKWGLPLPENPAKLAKKPKSSPGRTRRLKEGEWERITEALEASRNPFLRPLVELALETAMRRSELLAVLMEDVDWEAHTLRIPKAKNGYERTIPLTVKAETILQILAEGTSPKDHLIKLSAEAAKLAWQRTIRRAHIADLHFHDLRHEGISRLFEKGMTIPEVAHISGHRDPRMLFRYTHLKAENVARKLRELS